MDWLNRNGLGAEVLKWMDKLPAEITTNPPPAIAIADAFAEAKNWSRLETVDAQRRVGRLGISAPGLSGLRFEAGAADLFAMRNFRGSGDSAERAAAEKPDREINLARLASKWNLPAEAEHLWLRVSKNAPMRREALDALYRIYRANNDLPNLYRVAQRLHESSPNEPGIAANYARLALAGGPKPRRRPSRWRRKLTIARRTDVNAAMTYAFSLYGLGRTAEGMEIMKKLPAEGVHDPHAAVYAAILFLDENQAPRRAGIHCRRASWSDFSRGEEAARRGDRQSELGCRPSPATTDRGRLAPSAFSAADCIAFSTMPPPVPASPHPGQRSRLSSLRASCVASDFANLRGRRSIVFFLRRFDLTANLRERRLDRAQHFLRFEFRLRPDAFAHVVEGVLERFRNHLLHRFVGNIDGAVDLDRFSLRRFWCRARARAGCRWHRSRIARRRAPRPFGAGSNSISNCPSGQLSRAISRSPCSTLIDIERCWLTAVVNISPALIGMVELRGMITFINPPNVSMPERERRDIEQHNIAHRAGQNAGLDRRPERHGFVRILRGVRLASENLRHHFAAPAACASLPPTRMTSSRSAGVEFRVRQRAQAMGARALDDRPRNSLQFVARQIEVKAFRAVEKREVDLNRFLRGKPMLRLDRASQESRASFPVSSCCGYPKS